MSASALHWIESFSEPKNSSWLNGPIQNVTSTPPRPMASYMRRSHLISSLREIALSSSAAGVEFPQAAFHQVIDFINLLPAARIADRVGYSEDGEISLFWECNGAYADLGFSEEGLSFYIKSVDGQEFFGDEREADFDRLCQLIEQIPPRA